MIIIVLAHFRFLFILIIILKCIKFLIILVTSLLLFIGYSIGDVEINFIFLDHSKCFALFCTIFIYTSYIVILVFMFAIIIIDCILIFICFIISIL